MRLKETIIAISTPPGRDGTRPPGSARPTCTVGMPLYAAIVSAAACDSVPWP